MSERSPNEQKRIVAEISRRRTLQQTMMANGELKQDDLLMIRNLGEVLRNTIKSFGTDRNTIARCLHEDTETFLYVGLGLATMAEYARINDKFIQFIKESFGMGDSD